MTTAQAAVYVARPTTSYRLLALGAGSREVGLVAAAFAVVPLFVAIPLGRFSDRRTGLPMLLGGCAIQSVACVLLGIAGSAGAVAAASALLGIGHLGLALGVQEVIARESAPSRHDQHFGLLTAGVALGQLVGPLVGGLLLHGSGRSLVGATATAMFVAAGFAGAAAVFGAVADGARSRIPAAPAPSRRGSLRRIVSTRGVPAGIFASVAVLSAADVFTAYMPVVGEQHAIAPSVVGALLAVRAAASMGARVGIGTLVGRIGRLRLISLSSAAAAAAFAGMTFTQNTAALVALTLVVGFGLGFGQPLSMTMVVQLVPRYAQATALAVRLTGNRLGQVAAPAAAGLVAGSAGVSAVFWLLAGLLLASATAVRRPALARQERAAAALAEAAGE